MQGRAYRRPIIAWVDEAKADRAVRFFNSLVLLEGRWAGQRMCLLPWEEKIIRDVFGTMRDGTHLRQYRTVYIEVPKKSGKTNLCAGFVNYLLTFDGEPAPEVYGAAVDRIQAGLVYRPAANMVRQNPALSKRCVCRDSLKRIVNRENNGFYQVLSAEVPQKHGLNVHGCVIDELHAQPNRDLYDVLTKYSGSARTQPLWIFITTAGVDRNSICYELHEKARQVLNGTREDDTFYPVIYGLGDDEDWTDEANWYKVNPSLGKILSIEDFRRDFNEAKGNPVEENLFRQLRLNQWVKQSIRAIDLNKWDVCARPVQSMTGRPCYGGLDLSSTDDLTALAIAASGSDGYFDLLVHAWIPEDRMREHENRHRVPYTKWVRMGLITPTPGSVIDYAYVTHDIAEICETLDLREMAFDRWGAAKVIQDLEELGFSTDPKARNRKLIQFGQGYKDMSPATKEFLRLVADEKLRHGGNPLLRWNADNFVIRTDPAGNAKPDKEKATMKIDAIVASIMALDRAGRHETAKRLSVYDREMRGIEVL